MQIPILIIDDCCNQNRGYKETIDFAPKSLGTVALAQQVQDALAKKWKLSQLASEDCDALIHALIAWVKTNRPALDNGDSRHCVFEFHIQLPPPIPPTPPTPAKPRQPVDPPKLISSWPKIR